MADRNSFNRPSSAMQIFGAPGFWGAPDSQASAPKPQTLHRDPEPQRTNLSKDLYKETIKRNPKKKVGHLGSG